MMLTCCVKACKSESYLGCGISFYKVPKNEEIKQKWINAVPGYVTKYSVVCGLHFKAEDFATESYALKKKLKTNAVPSIFPRVFEHVYSAGFHPSDILESIASMRANPGMPQLLQALARENWHVLVLTDANSVFVHHWLETHGLQDCVTEVITNRAFWRNDRLYIEPCMRQTTCQRCPSNLCKSLALAHWTQSRQYERIVYAGDGRNDYCPATTLPSNAIVFPRKGFPMDDLIQKTLASPSPQVKCAVVPWSHANTILQTIFPGKTAAS